MLHGVEWRQFNCLDQSGSLARYRRVRGRDDPVCDAHIRQRLYPAYSVEKLPFGADAIFQFYRRAAENPRET
jgi:hypothetical protein